MHCNFDSCQYKKAIRLDFTLDDRHESGLFGVCYNRGIDIIVSFEDTKHGSFAFAYTAKVTLI
jgi:hypothetical protein